MPSPGRYPRPARAPVCWIFFHCFLLSLPLARPGVIAGAVLAFARSLGEFGATLLFAGSRPGRRTLSVQLFVLDSQQGADAEQRLWRLVVASVLLACAAVALANFWTTRGARRESA